MLGLVCPKVKPEDLASEEKFRKWVQGKVDASHAQYPHQNAQRVNEECWLASEYWYTYSKGVQSDKSEEVTEKMEKISKKPELMPAASDNSELKVRINKQLVQGQKLAKAASKQLSALLSPAAQKKDNSGRQMLAPACLGKEGHLIARKTPVHEYAKPLALLLCSR